MVDQDPRAEVNRLYWESDQSVGDIADRMGLSRRALYDEIDPLPVGLPCPECGGPLGYRNRTSQDSGDIECPECGLETRLSDVEPRSAAEQQRRAAPLSPTRHVPGAPAAPMAALLLLAGIGMGAAAAYLLHRP